MAAEQAPRRYPFERTEFRSDGGWLTRDAAAAEVQRPIDQRSHRRGGAPRHQRTDPTLYEWERLTPDQQRTVLNAIAGRRGSTTRRVLVTALVYALALMALVTIVGAYLIYGR